MRELIEVDQSLNVLSFNREDKLILIHDFLLIILFLKISAPAKYKPMGSYLGGLLHGKIRQFVLNKHRESKCPSEEIQEVHNPL